MAGQRNRRPQYRRAARASDLRSPGWLELERQAHQGLKVEIRKVILGEDHRSHLKLERQRQIVLEEILDAAAEQDRKHELSIEHVALEDDEHRQLEGQSDVQGGRGVDAEHEPDRNRDTAARGGGEKINQRAGSELDAEVELAGVHQISLNQALKLEAGSGGDVHVAFKAIVEGENTAEIELGVHAVIPGSRNSWPARLHVEHIYVRSGRSPGDRRPVVG